ncbi:LOW QUALITY PROTEIN: retinol dehydrogenase 16 [Monodelphis domestica]|uniref:LOW QUALITY PROTEIN: retinol dehydrogenase 16 n=1 Tax=Monodelphis domestica TaxID=13616 RepID=UPI0024E1AD77|nr:LOW QUALITY PROTEIN: retinol dehydrogenase 16 [Monodelphis domestica]
MAQDMWLYLAVLVGLYFLFRWLRERQVVSNLGDKYVFITGCDSGFGNLLAKQLDLRGLRVLAACLSEEGAQRLRRATSERVETVILDVTKTESITAAAQWVKERVGNKGLWGLVNNAGISMPTAPNDWLTKEDFLRVINVNLIGLIEVTLSLLSLVRKAKGRIVNVSSIMGRLSLFGGGYCISKYGVEAFSDSLRRELYHSGVRIAMIEPGFFKTNITNLELFKENFQSLWEQLDPEVRQHYGQKFFDAYMRSTVDMQALCKEDLSLVTNCMQHALTSRHPRSRYSAGWDAKLFYLPCRIFPLSYLPTALADFLIMWNYPKPSPTR